MVGRFSCSRREAYVEWSVLLLDVYGMGGKVSMREGLKDFDYSCSSYGRSSDPVSHLIMYQ